MTNFLIDFDWYVDDGGYELVPEKPPPEGERVHLLSGTPAHILRCGGPLRRYRPLEIHHQLYIELAQADPTPEGCVEFASKFGYLGHSGRNDDHEDLVGPGGESPVLWIENIKDLQNAVELWKAGILEDGWATRGEWKIANIDAVMKPAPPDGALRIHFRPRSLIGAIHLQLAQAATSGADVGTCEHCGLWFEMGPNGRKRGAKTCSRMCQIDMNNQKRKTKGASQ